MKTSKTYILVFIFVLALLSLPACQTKDILLPSGNPLDNEFLDVGTVMGLSATGAEDGVVRLVMTYGEENNCNPQFSAYLTKPQSANITLQLALAPELVESFSRKTGVNYKALPPIFCTYPEGQQLVIPSGEVQSVPKSIQISSESNYGDILQPGRYLLAVKQTGTESTHAVYVDILVREKYENDVPLYTGDDMFLIFYINTAKFDPRLVTDYYLEGLSRGEKVFYAPIGNILNLRKSIINYDENEKKPFLDLYADMKYVLENRYTYIVPVQESGRKVCLCIEGGGKGIGFCNLTDAQIEDLTSQIVTTIEHYQLDGVNLWDRGSNYGGVEGKPAMNTTSYPKFIKRLREKLGNKRLLTLVDYEEPTAYFWNTEATGGIEVGKLVDYAWVDFPVAENLCPVIDPWHQDADCVSKDYPRKPIAGMDPQRFGCTNGHTILRFTLFNDLKIWEEAGLRQSNVFAFEDMRSNLQGRYEGVDVPSRFLSQILNVNKPDRISYQINSLKLYNDQHNSGGYGKWLKDW